MSRKRTALLAFGWALVAVVLWNVLFDLYVSRGAREYLQLRAEFDLGLVAQPSMAEVIAGVLAFGAYLLLVASLRRARVDSPEATAA